MAETKSFPRATIPEALMLVRLEPSEQMREFFIQMGRQNPALADGAGARIKEILSPRQGGFTLVELVVTMIVVGILAVVALPRFADQGEFNARGFADQARAALQFAQKSAVASRRCVCVAADAGGLTFTRDPANSTGCSTAACSLPLPIQGAASSCTPAVANRICPPANVALASTAANFSFDAQGQASAGATLTVAGTTVVVEQATGYVH